MTNYTWYLLALALCGCSATTIHFASIRNYSVEKIDSPIEEERVQGEDCTATVFGGQVNDISAQRAFDHAVRHAYAELTDVSIRMEDRGTFIVGERCIIVSGILVERVDIP